MRVMHFPRRIQAFEFNDHPKAPRALRDTVVETLSRALEDGHVLAGLVQPFGEFLTKAGTHQVLDLCAGAGGPASILGREFERAGRTPPSFLMTDLFPRTEKWSALRAGSPHFLDFVAEPVDATQIPSALADQRVRTIINAFHHFPPELASSILADAVRGSRGIFISEAFERDPIRASAITFHGVPALLANPFRSTTDRAAKFAMTWASPIALAVGGWDTIVSALRIYSEADLRTMVAPLGDRFSWVYGTYAYAPYGRGSYFYGTPKAGAPDAAR